MENEFKKKNLEVVCKHHHILRHMRYRERTKEWIVDYEHLAPRNKLEELRKLLMV